ncbi:MAG: hypothetical protein K2X47_13845 [Bdellovibrionales bacterium]|nr:hypothetical protein [Bdellovibrionales bacterium]
MKNTLGVLLLLSLFTTACGSSSSNGTSSAKAEVTAKKEEVRLTETTDRSGCHGAPTVRNTPFQTWKVVHKGTGVDSGIQGSLTMRLTFTSRGMTISNNCSFNGQSGYVSIDVDARVDESAKTIEILQEKTDSRTIGNVTCSVSAALGKFNYEVVGNCLKASGGSDSGTAFFVSDDGI